MSRNIGLSLVTFVLAFSYSVFAQVPERIVQPIIVNGQQVQGVIVVENGLIQSQTCPLPQQYVTPDQSSSGWACFEPSTGTWLLHAQPPVQVAPQGGPTIIYSQPAPVYVAPPVYSYGYYPFGYPYYSYPYFFGPSFGFRFGFGYRSPIIINRPFVGRPFIARPGFRFAAPRPVIGGFSRGGRSFGRVGRR